MTTKTIEGQEYILKSTMEQIIKDRVSKIASRASGFESQIMDLKSKLEDSQKGQSNVDLLTSKIEELSQKLNSSESKFSRYQSISKHGISDQRMVAAIEWTYEYEQERLLKKDRLSLSDWLDKQVADTDNAPLLLRPHLKALSNHRSDPGSGPQDQISPSSPSNNHRSETSPITPPPPPPPPPRTNQGAIVAPESQDFMTRALKDPVFYEQNRPKIKEAWKSGEFWRSNG